MSFRYYCRACKQHKPSSAFYQSRKSKCKECVRAMVAAHRAANIEAIRAYDRGRGFRGRPTLSADYKDQHPERRAAQVAIGNALRDGRITPWPCCALPECAETNVEAHHSDYDQPLAVVWLCPPHHKQAHAMARAILKDAA